MSTQTDKLLKFFIDDRFTKHRNILLVLIILIISAEIAFNGFYEDMGRYYIFTSFVFIFLFLILFNLHFLAPRFLLKNKLLPYFFYLLLSVFFSILLIASAQYLSNIRESLQSSAYNYSITLINIISTVIILGLAAISSSSFLLFQYWISYDKKINELNTINYHSELKQLKNQINPHFLFNMLNNVTVLIKKNPEEASQILHKLSSLLKYQITDNSKEFTNLESEIQFLTDYLNLEKIRRDHFEFTISATGNTNIPIFPLLFIPFVENAVKHNPDNENMSYVNIKFEIIENVLKFTCVNSKPKEKTQAKVGGLGLTNIRRRLELLFPESFELDIKEKETSYEVTLNLFLKSKHNLL